MNHYVQVNLTSYGNYFDGESSNEEMEILGSFLTSDIGLHLEGFKKWANEEGSSQLGGNITDLEKNDTHIFISYDPYLFDTKTNFKIPKQAFIDLLDDWEKMCKQKPPHILVTYDGYRFTVKGIND